jgi:hypothetical protein
MLWVRISIRARCSTLCDKVCQWLATGRRFSPGPPVSSTNKTDSHDITELLLKVALNTKQTNSLRLYINLNVKYFCKFAAMFEHLQIFILGSFCLIYFPRVYWWLAVNLLQTFGFRKGCILIWPVQSAGTWFWMCCLVRGGKYMFNFLLRFCLGVPRIKNTSPR